MTNDGLIVSTARPDIVLRQLALKDAEPLFRLIERNREHLSQGADTTSYKYPDLIWVVESIKEPGNPKEIRFGIWWENFLVGTISFEPVSIGKGEIAYWVGSEYCGRGFATVAVIALVTSVFKNTEIRAVTAAVHKSNLASQAVLRKAGFQRYETVSQFLHFEKTKPERNPGLQ